MTRVISPIVFASFWLLSICSAPADDIIVRNNNNFGPGSLRQAIQDNNVLGGGNTIIFSNTVTGTITLTSGELLVTTNLTIRGPGPGVLALSGNNSSRIFNISGGTVTISGLTIANGLMPGNIDGGGILSSSALVLSNCIFSDNRLDLGEGGAIASSGRLIINRCAFLRNRARGGGALFSTGPASVTNCTFVGNIGEDAGGGICNFSAGNLELAGCTIVQNRSIDGSGGGLFGDATVVNTIIANNLGHPNSEHQDLSSVAIVSEGYNLIGVGRAIDCDGIGDQFGSFANRLDPVLLPLGNYGGETPTMPPALNSPAIDQGKNFGVANDQRGRPRPLDNPSIINATLGDGTDIGAVETGAITWTVTTTNDSGAGSLRQAIANTSVAEVDTILFAPNVTNTITLTSGEIVCTGKLWSIQGPGANRLSISGNGNNRLFNLHYGSYVLSGLTLTNGSANGDLGGNFLINRFAYVVLQGCRITRGQAAEGGGFWNAGTLQTIDCTVDGNVTSGAGAAFANSGDGSITAVNCTIASNISTNQNGTAIFNNGTLYLESCTIASNTVSLPEGRVIRDQNTATLLNTIVANNVLGNGTDVSGSFSSLGYNIIGVTNDGTGFGVQGDQFGVNPLPGPLAYYGGKTPTMALRHGSPAMDKGKIVSRTTDQRSVSRFLDDPAIANASGGDGSDIGAYEADPQLRIVDMSRVGNNIALSLMTVLERNYRVEFTNEIASGSWTSFTNNAPGNGHLLWVTNAGGAGQSRRFYRGVSLP